MGRIFDLGVREGGTIFIWGVQEYQKVENP